jgi:hypothetical protein
MNAAPYSDCRPQADRLQISLIGKIKTSKRCNRPSLAASPIR